MDSDKHQREIKELRERLSRFSAAVARINSSLDLDTVLREIVENACEMTGALYGTIITINETGQADDFVSSGFTQKEHERLLHWPDGPKLFEYIRDLRGVATFKNLPTAAHSLFSDAGLLRAKTFIGTPLHYYGQHIGNFFLQGKKDGSEFTSEDEKIQAMFTSLAANAVANARTYRHEQRLRTDLEALVDTAPVGVAVFDARAGHPVLLNQEARRLVDRLRMPNSSHEQLLGYVLGKRADGREFSLRETTLAHQFKDAELVRGEEIELSVPDGRSVRMLLNATPIRSEDGTVESMVVTMQDLASLTELERSRAEFISMVSHELRIPLTSIKGSTASLLGASTALERAEVFQFIRIIDGQADHMRDLLSDLMDVGHINTGTVTIDPESWEVADIVERARNAFLSSGSGHTVTVDIPSDLPQVLADSLRIVQVLNNLFSNAAKHSPSHSPIRVTAESTGIHVAISVVDEGTGIPAELLPRLFQANASLQSDKQKGLRGAGLGLAICKGLVEAHGGRIQAFSNGEQKGTRITFTLPIAEEEAYSSNYTYTKGAHVGSSQIDGEPTRILVVDDDPNTLHYIRSTLAAEGYDSVVTADHENLASIIGKVRPQLVLLDLMLPNTDGITLMDNVPELADVPVIFISGYRKDETIARALDAGAEDYIAKPFSPTELTARIRTVLRRLTDLKPFVLGNLAIDYEQRRVTLSGRPVKLTASEYEVLRLLSLKPGRVLKYSTLLHKIWGNRSYAHPGLVRSVVMKLRRKLGKNSGQPEYIINEHGVGYRMAISDNL